MSSSNVTSKIIVGLLITVVVIACLVAFMIVAFAIKNRITRKAEEKANIVQQTYRKQGIENEREKKLEERAGITKKKKDSDEKRNKKIDDVVEQIQYNDIFSKIIKDLNLHPIINGNSVDFQRDSQNRIKNFFSSEGEFPTSINDDRKKRYNESKQIVSDLQNKQNKTSEEKEKLEWANVYIKFHEENLKKLDPDVRSQEFFKRLGMDSTNIMVNLLLYRGSVIYEYFKKYTLDKLQNDSSFHKDGFKKECLYIAQNICRESLRRMEDKNLNASSYNQELDRELKIFDGLFFKEIYESFQSRLKMIKEDLSENTEYNEMMNRPKTDNEVLMEWLEGIAYEENKNSLADNDGSNGNIIFNKQHKAYAQENYLQVVPNPYLEGSGFDRHGNYQNDPRYNHDMNLQQQIIYRDQKVRQSKTQYKETFDKLLELPQNKKKTMIKEQIITPRSKQKFVIGFEGLSDNNIDHSITIQKERTQARKDELENIKNIGDKNQKLQAILKDRKKNADFNLSNIYHRVEDKKIKLDFSKEYLKELKYIDKKELGIVQRINAALQNKDYKKLILEFYKEENNLGNADDKALYKNYLNSEKERYKNDTQIVQELNSILQKVNNSQDIGEYLKNYHLERYLEEEIKIINDTGSYLERIRKEFDGEFTENDNDIGGMNNLEDEALENSFINEKQSLFNKINTVTKNQDYNNKIKALYDEANALLVGERLSYGSMSMISSSESSIENT